MENALEHIAHFPDLVQVCVIFCSRQDWHTGFEPCDRFATTPKVVPEYDFLSVEPQLGIVGT